SFVQLAGRDRDDMILVEDIAMALNFGPEQRRSVRFGQGGGGQYPSTRMGEIAQMRQAFYDAQDYRHSLDAYQRKSLGGDKKATAPKRDLKLEALLPYLDGKRPVIVGAEEGSDVKTAMRLAQDFKLKVILNHVT